MRIEFSSTPTAYKFFLEYAASILNVQSIDWDNDTYHHDNSVITTLVPGSNSVQMYTTSIYRALAFKINILSYEWLILSAAEGRACSKVQYTARLPDHNPQLFKDIVIAVNQVSGEKLLSIASAFGPTGWMEGQSPSVIHSNTIAFIIITDVSIRSPLYGGYSGRITAVRRCETLGIYPFIVTQDWIHSCIRDMRYLNPLLFMPCT